MISPRRRKPLKLIQYNDVWLRLADPLDRERLKEILGYWKVRWVRKKRTANHICMVSKKGWMFAGFLPYLQERFDVEIEYKDTSEKPRFKLSWAQKVITLRDYQEDAILEASSHLRGVVSMPTGTGKTVVAAGLLAAMPKARALFVVHTKDLLDQTISEFGMMLGKTSIGFVGEGKVNWRQRTVGMIQSLKDYDFKKNPVDIVMVDECHHTASPSYVDLLKKIKCPVRLGFTGTTRTDQEGFLKSMGILGPTIFHYPYRQAVAEEWLSQAHIRMLRPPLCMETAETTKFRQVYNDDGEVVRQGVYELGIINHQGRNELIVREAGFFADRGMTVLVQVKETVHGEILDEMFAGRASYIHGGTDREQRLEVKKQLKAGKTKITIASPVWDEGINIPDLHAIIVAGGGMSPIKSVQKIGRGLRKTEEKSEVQIIDFYDSSHKYLRKHSKERMRIYEERGWIINREYE